MDLSDMWSMIDTGDKYLLDKAILQDFCHRWYSHMKSTRGQNLRIEQSLLFLFYALDSADAFAETTRWIIFNSEGDIEDLAPDREEWEHLRDAQTDYISEL
jgi:hypothetical protein